MNTLKMFDRKKSYFNILWISSIINDLGGKTSILTMPLIAISFFHTDVTKTAFVTTMQFLPHLFFSFFFANLVSKTSKKQILLGITNILSALLTMILIILIIFNLIYLWQFYLFLFLINSLSVLSGITHSALIVCVVEHDKLIDANSKLAISDSLLKLSAPSIGGVIIKYLGYLFALIFDTLTFLIAGVMQFFIKTEDNVINKFENKKNSLKRTFSLIYHHKLLFNLYLVFLLITFSLGLFQTIQIFHLTTALDFTESEIGLIISVGSLGMVLMSFLSKKYIEKIGLFKSILSFVISITLAFILYFSAQFINNSIIIFIKILLAQFLIFLFNPVFSVASSTIRQQNVKKEYYPSVLAIWTYLTRGILPISSILAGFIYENADISGVMIVCFSMVLICLVILYINKKEFKKTKF